MIGYNQAEAGSNPMLPPCEESAQIRGIFSIANAFVPSSSW